MTPVAEVWVYLSASPLLHLVLTLAAYQAADAAYRRAGRPAALNPVLVSILALASLLALTGTPYGDYFDGAQFVHFLLGPATVALAIPLYRQLGRVRRSVGAILAALTLGSAAAVVVVLAAAWLLGGGERLLASLAPKSATAAIAMATAERIGGAPALTAVFAIMTGILGAALGPPVLRACGIDDPAARGLALGTASHGIGTARALQESEVAGAFAGIAMGLNGIATAVLVPLVWLLVMG